MYLQVNSANLGDLSEFEIWGAPAVGGGVIGISTSVAWKSHAEAGQVYSGQLQVSTKDQRIRWPDFNMTRNWIHRTFAGHTDQMVFETFLTYSQLEHIETLRNGRELELNLDMRLDADRPVPNSDMERRTRELWRADGNTRFPATQWTQALERVGFRRSLFLEMTYPFHDQTTDPLPVRLKKARDAFDRGEYERVLADVRQILELIEGRRADKEAVEKAFKAYKAGGAPKEEMSLQDRLLLVRRSIENVAHLGHHPSNDAVERKTAKAMLAFAATLLELYPEL